MVQSALPSRKYYLFRDPRDVYLSANAFNRARGTAGFGRRPGDSDLDHARMLALGQLLYWENFVAERGRDDTSALRYEDLIADSAGIASRLSTDLGLNLSPEIKDQSPAIHRTSAAPAASVERWRREGLPAGVAALLESQLHDCLTANGYAVTAPPANNIDLTRCGSQSGAATLESTSDGLGVRVSRGDS